MKSGIRKTLFVMVVILLGITAYYLYDMLHVKTQVEKLAEIIHFEDLRTFNDDFQAYLDDPDPVVRERAALSLGRVRTANACEILYEKVTTDVMDVASTAAFAMGLTTETEYAPRLLDIAFDAPTKVGLMAVESAGRLADSSMTETIDLLTTFLNHPSPEVREAACYALFRANAKNMAPALVDFVENETDTDARVAALYALSRMRIVDAFEVYEEFLADSDPFPRSLAVRGIGLSDSKEALNYLYIALNDGNRNVVAQAILSLSNKTDKTSKAKLVSKLKKEKDEKLIAELIKALQAQENPDGVEFVKFLMTNQPTDLIVENGVSYLASIEGDRTVMLLDSLMLIDNRRYKAACADAFGTIGDDKVIPRLVTLFNDKYKTVRATAFGNLLTIDSSNAEFYITKALEDSSDMMNILAIDQIGSRKLSGFLDKLFELSKNRIGLSFDIRRSLISCTGEFLRENSQDTVAVKMLSHGLGDMDHVIRAMSAEINLEIFNKNSFNLISPARTRYSSGDIEEALIKYKSNPYAKIVTSRGEIEMELYFDVSPLTVMNFIEWAENGYYEGLTFHRVVPNFVVQGGDPDGTGWGGAPYNNRCEYSSEEFIRGTVGIATSGMDTGSSQFFITLTSTPHLNGRYTVFGQVLDGMEVVDDIVIGDEIKEIIITQAEPL